MLLGVIDCRLGAFGRATWFRYQKKCWTISLCQEGWVTRCSALKVCHWLPRSIHMHGRYSDCRRLLDSRSNLTLRADFGDFCIFRSFSHMFSIISKSQVSKHTINRDIRKRHWPGNRFLHLNNHGNHSGAHCKARKVHFGTFAQEVWNPACFSMC